MTPELALLAFQSLEEILLTMVTPSRLECFGESVSYHVSHGSVQGYVLTGGARGARGPRDLQVSVCARRTLRAGYRAGSLVQLLT